MYLSILVITIIVTLFILNLKIEKYTDLWDATSGQKDIKKFTDGLFSGIKDALEGAVLGIDSKIPGQKPCSDWDSRYRDDGTSCWLDTYGRGAGRLPDLEACPPRSTANWAGDCYADQTDREDGRNDAEPWGKSWDKSDGCSWNRHIEAGACFRACPEGYFGRAYDKCWANGADSFGVMKRLVNRKLLCNADEELWGALCYPKCKSGFHAVGCCLCEPDDGVGIKKTAFQRYECPPPDNADYVNLKGALCYRDLPSEQGKKQILNSNGQAIKCNTDVPGGVGAGAFYRVEDGKLRWYPNERIANSWDSNWKAAKMIADCSAVERINDMRYKSEDQLDYAIKNNRSVQCGIDVNGGAGAGAVYKVVNGKLRWYPNEMIANSWDTNWKNIVRVDDCTITSKGDDMKIQGPTLRNERLGWQGDGVDDGGGGLSWGEWSGGPWNKYYKVSCKDDYNDVESEMKGPFGPVNFSHYNKPVIRLADDDKEVCYGNTRVTIYRSDSRDGPYTDISNDLNLTNKENTLRYNRTDSVFRDGVVVPNPSPTTLSQQATFFEHNNYQGRSWKLGGGNYKWVGEHGISNDVISSVKVPKGGSVVLYDHANFGGASITLTENASSLGDFDNRTSSIKVSNEYVPPPNLNDILWQRGNYNTGDLNWMAFSNRDWNKYYKISCKSKNNNESIAKGPFGPVTGSGLGIFNYPNIRLSTDNVSPCWSDSKVTVYRSDSRDGPYTDISSDPRLLNKANNAKYNRFDAVFTDNIPA